MMTKQTPPTEKCLISACLDYRFKDRALLELALTHGSKGFKSNNQRLEFLGDSVLGSIISHALFQKFPQADEGDLTRLRALLVKTETLADLARKMDLGQHIKLGLGEEKSGGWRRTSILANVFESVLGAIYLDGGFAECERVVGRLYRERLQDMTLDKINKDSKTLLQEYLQARKMRLPVYQLVKTSGHEHNKTFTIQCAVEELKQSVEAEAGSKRLAQQKAAARMLELLQKPKPGKNG